MQKHFIQENWLKMSHHFASAVLSKLSTFHKIFPDISATTQVSMMVADVLLSDNHQAVEMLSRAQIIP